MGFMTVVSVLNDACHQIENDPTFGRRLIEKIGQFSRRASRLDKTVSAYSWRDGEARGVFCNAAEIVCQSHADHKQFVCAWRNAAWEITTDPNDGVPPEVIKELRWMLRERQKQANPSPTKGEKE